MAKCQPGNEQGIRNCTQNGALPEPFPSGRAPPGAAGRRPRSIDRNCKQALEAAPRLC